MTNNFTRGGCQCGAIRYLARNELVHPHICHCRMCQKAAGNYFMPLAGVKREDFEVTRGEISWFASSDPVRRGFCSHCGTPLLIDSLSADHVHILLGSLDDPVDLPPVHQFGLEAKMPWFDQLAGLKGTVTERDAMIDQDEITRIRRSNHQHPDHHTHQWPPK